MALFAVTNMIKGSSREALASWMALVFDAAPAAAQSHLARGEPAAALPLLERASVLGQRVNAFEPMPVAPAWQRLLDERVQ
jgi:hypothetical protein